MVLSVMQKLRSMIQLVLLTVKWSVVSRWRVSPSFR